MSPPPPFENENLDPEGEIYLVGDGDIKDSPPPPLENEKLDLDGDVYCSLLVAVEAAVEDGTVVDELCTTDLLVFVCFAEFVEIRWSYRELGDKSMSPQLVATAS